jgi:hypothetical protein
MHTIEAEVGSKLYGCNAIERWIHVLFKVRFRVQWSSFGTGTMARTSE